MTDNKQHPMGQTQIERDLAVIRRVAARDAAMSAGHPCVTPLKGRNRSVEEVQLEQIVYCTKCGRHAVSEIGQNCPHCERDAA